MTTSLIALGSNLGDRLENMRAGVSGLAATDGVEIVAVSGLYETEPVGGPDDQGAYYNAVVRVETVLSATDLLARLHRIEDVRSRRRAVRWGPRTLDLDLLVHGGHVSTMRRLHLPHPRMHERRFVMVPVCDVAADVVHPVCGRAMAEVLEQLPAEPGDLTKVADDWASKARRARREAT